MEKQPTDLMLIEELPALVVARATEQAKALMDIVEKRNLYQAIGDKKYLEVEAWQTIGAFNRVHALTDWVEPLKDNPENVNEITGYQAQVGLWKRDEQVGQAIMSCGLDEFPCWGKEGQAKHKAAKSAAQTWAESKAYRMNFAYIAVLAGYQPTPAEEMGGDSGDKEKPKGHWCSEHQTIFFKKGTMKSYAHKIEGTDQWCNEVKKTEKKADIQPPVIVATAPESETTPLEDNMSATAPIDLKWLKESLSTLEEKGLKFWTKANVLSYLNTMGGKKSTTITEAVKYLSPGQVTQVINKVKETLEMS